MGYFAYISWGTYWSLLFFWLYGTIYAFSGAYDHEARHRTLFKSRWANDFFGYKEYVLNFPKYKDNQIEYKNNKIQIDKTKKEFLQIPLNEKIEDVLKKEKQYLGHDVIIEKDSFRIGYEVIFNKYFKPNHFIRSPKEILYEINNLTK